ncbi:MAG: GNAT family N-acetyltransferase [Oscillospiraceae bacterium]|nr:GNAT family N-acetyltransferase [Oscillospiraceae bacterium]
MKSIETPRLILRKFRHDDFDAVHSYAGNDENFNYMPYPTNTEQVTREKIAEFIAKAEVNPIKNYNWAVTLRDGGQLIGGCGLDINDNYGSVGWLLHRNYWRQGYGTEIGRALLKFGFESLNLHRIIAECYAENIGSWGIMEKIGMRREGHFLDAFPAHKKSDSEYDDAFLYAMLRREWETQTEIARYALLPITFDGFVDLPELRDGELYFVCIKKTPYQPERNWMPNYSFIICKGGEKIGDARLTIGFTEGLYYGGQIGYNIDEPHRGNGYAARACRLLAPIAKAHDMTKLLISNRHDNRSSIRVCEKLGAKLVRTVALPGWHDLYKDNGYRTVNIFEWDLEA